MNKKRMIASIVELAMGIGLLIAAFWGHLDEYWEGMGIALIFVSVLNLLRQIRYNTNEEYREKVDLNAGDERNKYLALRAWAYAGYWFVLIAAVGSIVFKFLGHEDLMMLCGGGVCLVLILYWGSYAYLQKRY